jgi:O-antigen ligase
MMRAPEQAAVGRLLGWVALVTTVAVTPLTTLDPINLPKLAVISAGGFMSLFFIASNWKSIFRSEYKAPALLALIFVLDLILVLFLAGSNFNQEIFGANGRSTGFVAYLSLAGLLLAGLISGTQYTLNRFSWLLLGAGLLSIIYGLLQSVGADPANWVSPYSPVIGFLGNPDFQSAFMGFSGVMAFAMMLNSGISKTFRIVLLGFLATSLYVIKETQAQQGFLVLLGGIAVTGLIWVYKSRLKALTLPLVGMGFFGAVLIVLGSLNVGPLASLLHKASVIYRGDYWRAAWKMTMDHPFFGVGLDSYGDWYRRSRTIEATVRRGPEVTSNAAHNVLLDFSSNGGFLLLLIYLALMALVARAAFKVIRRAPSFNPVFTGLFAVWVAYQAQSIISLNQLGLAVWGWIISGLIIGYEINSRKEAGEVKVEKGPGKDKSKKAISGQTVLPSTVITLFVGLLIGLIIGLIPFTASAKYKSALESSDKVKIQAAAYLKPLDVTRMLQVSVTLRDNKFEVDALSIIEDALIQYPDSYDAWKVLASLTTASPAQITEAKAQMERLDPHNPNLK